MTTCGWNVEPLAPISYQKMVDSSKTTALDEAIGLNYLSCPQFAVTPIGWVQKKRKIVLVGQETCGWGFEEECPAIPAAVHRISTLMQAAASHNAIENICGAYAKFNLAKSNANLESTPFWRAHRLIANTLCENDSYAVMWLNVVAVDYCAPGGASNSMWWNLTYEQVDAVCEWQQGRLTEELKALDPTDIIFMSGPRYDYYLEKEFSGFSETEQDQRFPGLKLSKVSDNNKVLTDRAFRLYHPAYINRRGNWGLFEDFVASLAQK